jgi:hypothetical protein
VGLTPNEAATRTDVEALTLPFEHVDRAIDCAPERLSPSPARATASATPAA